MMLHPEVLPSYTAQTMKTLADIQEEEIFSLSAGELKALLHYHQVNYSGCVEKGEYVELAINAKRKLALPGAIQPAIVPYFGRKDKKDVDYYAILGVPKTAPLSEITRAYYKLARENHPDKNPNDPFAEERFKMISEAYQILSDPEKRQRYDQFGAGGLDEEFVDPSALFRMLFGNGKFDKIFGELSFCDVDFSGSQENGFDSAAHEKKQEERQRCLSHQLIVRLEPFVQDERTMFVSMNEQEAIELCEVPGGQDLLMMIGYVYIQEAKQHMDNFLGIPAFFYRVAEKGHFLKLGVETVAHVVRMQAAQARMEKDQAKGLAAEDGQDAMMQQGLKTIWAIGKLEIETTLRVVCEEVLRVSDKTLRRKRAKGLKLVGEIFQKTAKEMKNGGPNLFSVFGSPPQQPQPR